MLCTRFYTSPLIFTTLPPIYILPITRRFHPFPTLHFPSLHFTSLHFYTRLDDFHFTSLYFTSLHYTTLRFETKVGLHVMYITKYKQTPVFVTSCGKLASISVRKRRSVLNDPYETSVMVNYASEKCTENRCRVSKKKIHQHRKDKHQAMKEYTGGRAPCFLPTVNRQALMTFSRLWFMLRDGRISKPVSEYQHRNKSWSLHTGYFFYRFPEQSSFIE